MKATPANCFHLTVEIVREIHAESIAQFGGSEGVRDLALLESAVGAGWLPDGRSISLDLAEEPGFRGLRGNLRFEVARKRVLNHIARERAELGPLTV